MNDKFKRFLSVLLAMVMVFSTTCLALAHAEGEDGDDHEHDETPYAITIYDEKAPNKNGSLTYTVTCAEHGTVSEVYDAEDSEITAVEGDLITVYPVADEGYVLGSIGYVKSERIEQAFNIKSVTDQKDGSYTFTMPAYPVHIGAAFYEEDSLYVTGESGTSNAVANVDPRHVLELGLNHAWIHENTEEISVDMYVDQRILNIEEETGEAMTFRMEIRQVGDAGFQIKGAKEFSTEELQALIDAEEAQSVVDDKDRTYFILRDVRIPVDCDADFEYTEDGEYEVYCTAMFTLDGWTNAVGAQNYRWGYSGGDRAYILENDTPIPTSMVYLYNLDPETYHGALVAEAIDRVEEEMGVTIETRYFDADNMTECIGYLAEWPGYESFGELGVDRQPSEKVFKKKIVLYCSLPSMVRDAVGDAVRETGVTQYMTTKLTAYGASKSFEALYKNQEAESEVFTAALALSLLAYEASEAVPEAVYGTHELWGDFSEAMANAKTVINAAKEDAEPYRTAREQLLDVYLRILGKTQLTVDFEFVISEYDEENYKITVDVSEDLEDLELEYYWYDASKQDHLIIAKDQLYKVRCSVSAADDCPYYGFKEIRLAAPEEPEYEISAGAEQIVVDFEAYASVKNTPEPITYTAELYLDGSLVETKNNTTADSLIFTGLEAGTAYTIRLYASNIVGRTTYMTEEVLTCDLSIREGMEHGSVTIENETVFTGDMVILNVTPEEGYVVAQVGYWTVDEDGNAGKLVTVNKTEGVYSFELPEGKIVVGAAFHDEDLALINNKVGGSSETDFWGYTTNHHAFLDTADTAASAHVQVDQRFVDNEDITMRVEVRQYNTSGYKVAGTKELTHAEWTALLDGEGTLSNSRSYRSIYSVEVPLTEELQEGWEEYAVVQMGHPSWINAKGEPMYRWYYTNDAKILAEGAHVPQPIVWLYNLDADSHRGAIIRRILDNLEIETGTVNSENLGQNIGYLVNWNGYEAVENPYCNADYDVEYMLMGNLTDYGMDVLLTEMSKNNVSVALKSIPTAWTASKTFVELFDIMAEESETIRAAFALDQMIYDAEALTEDVYGNHELWDELQVAIEEALVALSTDAEETGEGAALYLNARDALREIYLVVSGKTLIEDKTLKLNVEENDNGTYTVTAEIAELENAVFSYNWNPSSSEEERTASSLIVKAEDMYKVKLEVNGMEDYYGELTATLHLPQAPELTAAAKKSSITVRIEEKEAINTPEVRSWEVRLYQGDEMVEEKIITSDTVTFTGLDNKTEYRVEVTAVNVIGRSEDAAEIIVATKSASSGSSSNKSEVKEETVQPEVTEPEETEPAKKFDDVKESAYYYAPVQWAVKKGITSGTGTDKFSPTATCTRAQMMTFLWKAAGCPEPALEECDFGDVSENAYYRKAVLWAVEQGLTSGVSADQFGSDQTVTRAQSMMFLWKLAGSPQAQGDCEFGDVAEGAYYRQAVQWAAEQGITSGTSAVTFGSDAACQRAQIVTFLYRTMAE